MHASCLCGDVTWEAGPPFERMHHCHCGRCRKAHGTAFATYAGVPVERFELRGAEHVAAWESAPGLRRAFCRRCGSVVPGQVTAEMAYFPCGNFDGHPGVPVLAHIFVASKAPWHEITDALPRFDAYPPGFDAPELTDRVLPPARSGVARGSCLCDAVAFEIEGPPILCRNCHCGRCRRARSAAHASNLGVRLDQLRFARGEAKLASYKVPEAERFTQTFCATCGAKMPRTDAARGIAIVPMGALDDDPGARPGEHIFVADKAPWFEITDALPQHAAYAPT